MKVTSLKEKEQKIEKIGIILITVLGYSRGFEFIGKIHQEIKNIKEVDGKLILIREIINSSEELSPKAKVDINDLIDIALLTQ